jgi:hypothetical protein
MALLALPVGNKILWFCMTFTVQTITLLCLVTREQWVPISDINRVCTTIFQKAERGSLKKKWKTYGVLRVNNSSNVKGNKELTQIPKIKVDDTWTFLLHQMGPSKD